MNKYQEAGLIEGIKICKNAPGISHLMFADDCMLFFKAKKESVRWIKEILARYEAVSGQKCPTTIVPFFGDQFFWGDRVHQKGLGPEPIPISQLTVENLSNAIRFMLQPEVKLEAMKLAKLIENEDGVAAAVKAFHRHLPPELPIRTTASEDGDQLPPNPIEWLFFKVGKLCSSLCGNS
ncbi:hypothetical protein QQ045_002061 [Rhodiola kirilowii]